MRARSRMCGSFSFCAFFCTAYSAFSVIQLQRLASRGHKPRKKRRQRAPSILARLMLVEGPQDGGHKDVAAGRGVLSL
ncbi:hypothetical protein BIV59_03725 [Bacillus sp. MUM 13]|nr:hypothetical protein BIV59_03725 [Bacillus sp. MUM 13]